MVDRAPLWPVHFGSASRVSGNPRVHQNFCLAGKAESGGLDQRVIDAELQPLAFASDVELRHVQLALVEVFIACCDTAANVGCVPGLCTDKFVDVFVAGIAAHVKGQGLANHWNTANCGLVRKATHGHSF